jgi:hypothetical protein
MLRQQISVQNLASYCCVLVLIVACISVVPFASVSAGPIENRSLQVTSTNPSDDLLGANGQTLTGLAPGDSRNGSQVGHRYIFTPVTSSQIQSLELSYCTTPFGYLQDTSNPCINPAGFSATNAITATVTTGATTATFTRHASSTANILKLTTTDTINFVAAQEVTIVFTATGSNYFVNPTSVYFSTNAWGTYFSHVRTYATNNWTTIQDEGTMTNAITNSIKILTRVQEVLKFSVGTADSGGNVVPEGATCAPLTGSMLLMGDSSNNALASNTAYDAHSYFRLSTNSSNGVEVLYAGDTLESGSLSIAAIGATKAFSTIGVEQFGLAIDTDGTQPADKFSFASLVPTVEYNSGAGTINNSTPSANAQFAFNTASQITPVAVASASGSVNCDTGSVRYLANVSNQTEAGIYTTKINYIAVASY